MYKVTLSMPIYNVAPYVERALLSALNQTFESIEFLLVDDRGTDNSMEIVRRIIENHPRGKDVRIIEHPHNIGLGAARNTAIDNAQGEYLFFMDSDDEITQDCIQVLYDRMMEEKVDMIMGSIKELTVDGKQIDRVLSRETQRGKFCLAEYVYKEKRYFPVMTWNKLYCLDFLRKNSIRCYDDHLNEDLVFSLHILFFLESYTCVSDMTLIYYRRVDSVTGDRMKVPSKRKIKESLDIMREKERYVDLYKGSSLFPFYLSYYVCSVCAFYINCICMNMNNKERISLLDSLKYNCLSKLDILKTMHKDYYAWKAFVFLLLPYALKKIIVRIYS